MLRHDNGQEESAGSHKSKFSRSWPAKADKILTFDTLGIGKRRNSAESPAHASQDGNYLPRQVSGGSCRASGVASYSHPVGLDWRATTLVPTRAGEISIMISAHASIIGLRAWRSSSPG